MPARRIPAVPVVVALATVTAVACMARHFYLLRRALDAERAARRLTAGLHQQDMAAFAARLHRAVAAQHALSQADLVLDSALATHHDPEGGSL